LTPRKKKKAAAAGKGNSGPPNPYVNSKGQKPSTKRNEILEVKSKIPTKDQERYSAIDRKLYRRYPLRIVVSCKKASM
jgi:hypothetical protein